MDKNKQEQEFKFLINDSISIALNLNLQDAISRCTILQGIFEDCQFNSNEVIKLQLSRPQGALPLFHYLQTGKIAAELSHSGTFSLYINDIIYLGLHELEDHVKNMLENCIAGKEIDQLDFSDSRPIFDFIESFIRTKQQLSNFGLCKLVMKWVGKNNIDRLQLEALTQHINFANLTLQQIKQLHNEFQDSFDLVIPPSNILGFVNSSASRYQPKVKGQQSYFDDVSGGWQQ